MSFTEYMYINMNMMNMKLVVYKYIDINNSCCRRMFKIIIIIKFLKIFNKFSI